MTEDDVCAVVGEIRVERLRVWVRNGWVRPGRKAERLVFTDVDIARARLVCHLEDDLAVEQESIPIVLSLMDQVYGLRAALRELSGAIERQPDDVRGKILEHLREKSAFRPGDRLS